MLNNIEIFMHKAHVQGTLANKEGSCPVTGTFPSTYTNRRLSLEQGSHGSGHGTSPSGQASSVLWQGCPVPGRIRHPMCFNGEQPTLQNKFDCACSVAVSYKPPMRVTRVRLPACANQMVSSRPVVGAGAHLPGNGGAGR